MTVDAAMDGKVITLVSRDGQSFTLPLKAARISETISNALAVDDDDEEEETEGASIPPFPIDRYNGECLGKLVAFMTQYDVEPMADIPLPLTGHSLEEVRKTDLTVMHF